LATFKRSFDFEKMFFKDYRLYLQQQTYTGNKSCLKKFINKGLFLQLAVYFISNFVI